MGDISEGLVLSRFFSVVVVISAIRGFGVRWTLSSQNRSPVAKNLDDELSRVRHTSPCPCPFEPLFGNFRRGGGKGAGGEF